MSVQQSENRVPKLIGYIIDNSGFLFNNCSFGACPVLNIPLLRFFMDFHWFLPHVPSLLGAENISMFP